MSETLKEKTVKGLFWGGISNGGQQLLNLFFGIFLARLLSAEDYGMVGMLTIFSAISGSLLEGGFIAALANKERIEHKDYNAVFWCSTLIGITLYTILFICSPLIADFYGIIELNVLAKVSFISILISALGIVPRAVLFRNLQIKETTIVAITALIISGVIGIVSAYNGMKYWGIVIQNLSYVIVTTILCFYYSSWFPKFIINFTPLKDLMGFSSRLLVANIFSIINNNVFLVLLGKFYSEKEVGFFANAAKWNSMGYSFIGGMMQGVAQPIFVQVKYDISRQRNIFRKMLRFTSFISFPAMFGLSLIAPELIVITITDKWLPASRILQLLCISGAFAPIIKLYSNLLISKGKSNIYMWNTISNSLFLIVGLMLFYPFGIQVMLIIYIIINICWLFLWQYFLWREIRLRLIDSLRDFLPFCFIALFAMLMTYFVTFGIKNIYILFISKIIISIALYFFTLWILKAKVLKESISYLIKRKIN